MTAGIPLGSLFVDLVSLKKFNVIEIMNICAKEFSLNGQWVIYVCGVQQPSGLIRHVKNDD